MNSIKISPKNAKLGKIPNISMVPIKDCGENAEHCRADCYALKAWRQYPAVRKAWKQNGQAFRNNPDQAFADLAEYLKKKNPDFFRIHVSGDFLGQVNLDGYTDLAAQFPNTRFLAFTKMHNLNYANCPDNLQIIFSMWPTIETVPQDRPRAWFQDGTESRIPDNALNCPGLCDSCGMCWHLSDLDRDVYFNKH